MLGYVNALSCDDPLTGLASLAPAQPHLRRLPRGGPARYAGRRLHALVVVSAPEAEAPPSGRDDALTRAMAVARLGDTAQGPSSPVRRRSATSAPAGSWSSPTVTSGSVAGSGCCAGCSTTPRTPSSGCGSRPPALRRRRGRPVARRAARA